MEIITKHESQQSAELRRPLWPIYSTFPHCTGPCDQGNKLCMTPEACQTGRTEDHDDYIKPPMRAADLAIVGALFAACWGSIALLAHALGWLQ